MDLNGYLDFYVKIKFIFELVEINVKIKMKMKIKIIKKLLNLVFNEFFDV